MGWPCCVVRELSIKMQTALISLLEGTKVKNSVITPIPLTHLPEPEPDDGKDSGQVWC